MYRKFQADHLFTGHTMLDRGEVLVMNNDEVVDIIPQAEAGSDIEVYNGILSPGFINAHCHLELSHMKDRIKPGSGLVDFVHEVVTGRHAEEAEILQSIETLEKQMADSGIVAIGDICNNVTTLNQKRKRRLSYYNFIEASGWLPSAAAQRFQRCIEILKSFSGSGLDAAIVPHAPYSVSDELWNKIIPYFGNKIISIHNQETAFEDEFFLNGSGDFVRMYDLLNIDNTFFKPPQTSSLQSYFPRLARAKSIILVHNTFTKQEDIDFIKKQDPGPLVSFCICINANQYIENAAPPVKMFINNNCNIILGTDSIASNYNLNMVGEMTKIQQVYPETNLNEMLGWATLNGAKALGFQDTLGSFEKGKTPGVVLIENVVNHRLGPNSASRLLNTKP